MGLAQQVQSSFVPPSSRANQQRSQRTSSSVISSFDENSEQNISKRLLNRRATTARQSPSYTFRSRIAINDNESDVSIGSKTEDAGIWVISFALDLFVEKHSLLVTSNPLLHLTSG